MVPIAPHPPWCRSLEWELLKTRQEEKFPHVDGSKDLLNACKQRGVVVERSEKNAFVTSDKGFLSNGKATEKRQFHSWSNVSYSPQ